MYVFCCGMYRSGSTWQYEIASHLVETKLKGRSLGFVNRDDELAAIERAQPFEGWSALKMHTRRPGFNKALAAGRAVAIYSHRDMRDVVFSMIKMRDTTFDEYSGSGIRELLLNDAYWRSQPHLLIQSYAEITQEPEKCIAQMAAHLGVTLDPGEAAALAKRFSKEENAKLAEEIRKKAEEKSLFKKAPTRDPKTLIHGNHIQDGKTGKWRDFATPAQIEVLKTRCGDWLIANGYEKDLDWK